MNENETEILVMALLQCKYHCKNEVFYEGFPQ